MQSGRGVITSVSCVSVVTLLVVTGGALSLVEAESVLAVSAEVVSAEVVPADVVSDVVSSCLCCAREDPPGDLLWL